MKNYWLDRKKKKDCYCDKSDEGMRRRAKLQTEYMRRRIERLRNFTRALATGGSVEINWEAIEKEEQEEKIKFEIPEIPTPEIPPITVMWDFNTPPPEINIPPMVFGTIDITGTGIMTQIDISPPVNIPTEIKLVAPDPMPVIKVEWGLPPTIPLIITDTSGPMGTMPLDIPSVITINSPEYRI
jgi:hypothetical protein